MQVVNSPSIPFWGHIPDSIHPGTVIQIDGHIPHNCHKFEVNLYCGSDVGHHAEKHSNIALQVRPKIHTKKVICNSRQYGSWGHKEKIRNFHHIQHGSAFNLQIIAEHQHFRIIFNGQDVCMFHHRIPFHEVRVLNIEGHPEVHRIEYRHQYGAQPSAPFYPSAPTYVAPVSYPQSRPIYPPSATVYPAPPVYVAPPMVQPAYVPQTIVVEDHHHHGHHGHGLGHNIADAIFGHDRHHGHHDYHHDSHHHHHGHHDHHW